MGGMVGQVFTLAWPDRVASLALLMTTSVVPETAPEGDDPAYSISHALMGRARARALRDGMAPIDDMCLDRWFTPGFVEDPAARRVGEIVAGNSPTGYAGGVDALMGFDVTARLGEIQAPTLVLAGELDPGTPLHCSRTLAAGIPDARLEIIPSTRHIANVERPDLVNGHLRAHLDRHA